MVEEIAGRAPHVTHSLAPHRERGDGWRSVAEVVRSVGDLARYSHPRYEAAPALRRRIVAKTLNLLDESHELEPIGRRLSRRLARKLASTTDATLAARVVGRAAALEEAIPTSPAIDRYVRDLAPDVVLVTEVVKRASPQVDYLKSARRLGIPTGICVASWDNLTTKGMLKFVPERVFVWNETQRREAVDLHGIPPERVVATGAQLFDEWFERRPSGPREAFASTAGLDPDEPYVLYLCSSGFVTASAGEVAFVTRWIEALRRSGDERLRRIGVLVRPYPLDRHWDGVDLGGLGNAVVWPPALDSRPVASAARAEFYDSIAHSSAVVGINTTAMIESAIVGKSVLTILAPEFAQQDTLHFRYLLQENGGFLHVAPSLDEHLGQLLGALDESPAEKERRQRFVERFVRPRGLNTPAAPIFADAVEELSTLRADSSRRRPLLRGALGLEAALCSLAGRIGHDHRWGRDLAGPVRVRLSRLRAKAP